MQRLLEDFLGGHLALGGHVEHGQADGREHRLLHDQDRRHQRWIAQDVRGDRQADVVGVQVQRVQRADGGVGRLQVEEQLVEDQEDYAHEHRREERDDDGGVEDFEDLLFGKDGEHQARAGDEEAEPVEHHLRGRSADAHARCHIARGDDDADDAETFHRA